MVTASLGGYLGKRVNVVLRGSYSWGAVNLDDNNYDTGLASARVQYALTSRLATYPQYFYYRYHFDEDVVLPPGYVPQQERQGVRVGLNFWLPVLR